MKKKKGKILLTLIVAFLLCIMCNIGIYAAAMDAGEIILYKSLETGKARYINYEKAAEPFSFRNNENVVYETDAYIPNDRLNGNVSTFSVIGSDGRVPATETNVFPNAAVLYVYTKWPDGKASRGTAFMVNKKQALTAGHCVYSSDHGGMAKSITVIPGRTGDEKPYGSYAVKSMYIGGKEGNTNADWGILTLGTDLGLTTGYYGTRLSVGNLAGITTRITGYPSDKGYSLWTQRGKIIEDSNFRLKYKVDTYKGQSGSPIYQEAEYRAVGIHTTGSSSVNSGVKLGERLFLLIGGKIAGAGEFTDGEYYTDYQTGPFTDGT